MGFNQHIQSERRLVILRLLDEGPGYTLNDSVLQSGLGVWGFSASRDQVRSDMAWLSEQGLVTVENVRDRAHVAALTGRGSEVARGLATVPGVARPSPGG